MPFSLHKAALRTGTSTFSKSSFGTQLRLQPISFSGLSRCGAGHGRQMVIGVTLGDTVTYIPSLSEALQIVDLGFR